MYKKILDKTPVEDEVRSILQTIIAAHRPLTLDEINLVMSIKERHRTLKDLEPCVVQTLRNLSGLFIRVIESKVYLVHQTGKEFLSDTAQYQSLAANVETLLIDSSIQ